MQPQTIKEIEGLPDKAVVYCFEGTVKKAFKRSEGNNSNGDWSIESFVLTAADGEIKLMLKDSPPAGWAPGTALRFEAWKGDKGFSGLYAADDTFKNETRRILRATKTCNITHLGGNVQAPPEQRHQQEAPPEQRHQQEAPPEQRQPRPKPTTEEAAAKAERHLKAQLNEAKRTMIQVANLHFLAAKIVETVEAPMFKKATGTSMTEGQRQGATASIYIECARKGLVSNMPTTPIEEF